MSANEGAPKSHWAQGNEALRRRDYDEALQHYRKAKDITPELARFIDSNIQLVELRRGSHSTLPVAAIPSALTATVFKPIYSLPQIATPGMITPDEEQLYYHLARTHWRPDREFIEFGTWLGRSTTRICQGFESVAPGRWTLACYDGFRWHDTYTDKATKSGMPAPVQSLKDGDSFRDAFLALMGGYAPRLKTFTGSVSEAPTVLAGAYPPDALFGVVFVDASKGWDNSQLLRAVAPHLAEGTRIVFQDFFMNAAYYLQLLLMMLPELEPEMVAERGGSFVVRVSAPIDPKHRLFQSRSIKTVSVAEIHAASDRLERAIPKSKYDDASLVLSRSLLLWGLGYQAEAMMFAPVLSEAQRQDVNKRLSKHPKLAIPPVLQACGAQP